tara:strand:+ start:145 stop:363 length:219 start_codon:yes stop_codon:yes gene_type:complete
VDRDTDDRPESVLEEYQEILLNLLDSEMEPRTIIEELKLNPRMQSLHQYIDSLEPEMIAVAKELIKKWGVKY